MAGEDEALGFGHGYGESGARCRRWMDGVLYCRRCGTGSVYWTKQQVSGRWCRTAQAIAAHNGANPRMPTLGSLNAWEFAHDRGTLNLQVPCQPILHTSFPRLTAALEDPSLTCAPEDAIAPHVAPRASSQHLPHRIEWPRSAVHGRNLRQSLMKRTLLILKHDFIIKRIHSQRSSQNLS